MEGSGKERKKDTEAGKDKYRNFAARGQPPEDSHLAF